MPPFPKKQDRVKDDDLTEDDLKGLELLGLKPSELENHDHADRQRILRRIAVESQSQHSCTGVRDRNN